MPQKPYSRVIYVCEQTHCTSSSYIGLDSERDRYIHLLIYILEGRKRQPLATLLLDNHTHSHIGILATKKFGFIEHMLKNYKLRSNRKDSTT